MNGKRAWCVDTGCKRLLIEYSPSRRIMVSFTGAGDQAGVARRVAESVRLDGRVPMRLPFTVAGIPATLKPQEVL